MSTDSITETEREVTQYVRMGMGFLSLLSSMFITLSLIFFIGELRKKVASRLVLMLSLCVNFTAFADILTPWARNNDGLCHFQGLALQLGQTGSTLWVTIIVVNLFLRIVLQYEHKLAEPSYHLAVWSLTAAAAVPPMVTGSYGHANIWCWISIEGTDTERFYGNLWRFLCFYVPIYCYLFLSLAMYLAVCRHVFFVFRKLAHVKTEKTKRKEQRLLRRLIAYPIICILLWVFPIINRLHDWTTGETSFALVIMHVVSVSSQGFFYSIAYGWNSHTQKGYRKLFNKEEKGGNKKRKQQTPKRGRSLYSSSATSATSTTTSSPSSSSSRWWDRAFTVVSSRVLSFRNDREANYDEPDDDHSFVTADSISSRDLTQSLLSEAERKDMMTMESDGEEDEDGYYGASTARVMALEDGR
ncbi:hypothetical protein QOT17_002645 [Balamuthia mandrillaris]